MREIKFRAKVLGRDQWVYGQYFVTPLTDENSGEPPEYGWHFLSGLGCKPHHCIVQNSVAFTIDLDTLGEFTGLRDKNGKEIYEGDILLNTDVDPDSRAFYAVKWDTEQGAWKARAWWAEEFTYCEVAGNVHENPDLLIEKVK